MPVFITSTTYHPVAGVYDSMYCTNPHYWTPVGRRRNNTLERVLCVSL